MTLLVSFFIYFTCNILYYHFVCSYDSIKTIIASTVISIIGAFITYFSQSVLFSCILYMIAFNIYKPLFEIIWSKYENRTN